MKTKLLLHLIVERCLLLVNSKPSVKEGTFTYGGIRLPKWGLLRSYFFNRQATINTMQPNPTCNSWYIPWLSKMVIPFIVLVIIFTPHLGAQDIIPTKPDEIGPELKDSTQLNAVNLPLPLLPLNGLNADAPYYRFLWIFGDGNFTFMRDSTFINHRYNVPSGESPKNFDVFLYKNALYGGGKPPPKRSSAQVISLHQSDFDTIPFSPKKVVKEGAVIHLQKHLDPLLPKDTSLWILSVKNPDTIGRRSLSGQVYLFHDGVIIEKPLFTAEDKEGKNVGVPAKALGTKTANFSKFQYDTTLLYANEIQNITFQSSNIPVQTFLSEYKKAMFWNFGNLLPGEERHIFVQFTIDSLLLDKFNLKQQGNTKLLAMLAIYNQEEGQFDFNLSEEDAKLRSELQLDSLLLTANLAGSGQTWFTTALLEGGVEQSFFAANQLVDLMEVESRLSGAYDPNYMQLEACSCPPNTEGAQKIISSIHFENDGQAPTRNIFVSLEVPEEIQLNSLFDSLLHLHPPLDPASAGEVVMEIDESTRTVTWKLLNFQIESVSQFGAGDPSTFGEIGFSMLTQAGIDITSVPEMQACVRFDEEDNEAVCTLPVKPTLLTEADVNLTGSAQILQCENCDCPPFNFWQWLLTLPWWLAVLILLVLVLIVWLFRRTT